MSAQHKPNPLATPEYWRGLARTNRVFARQAHNVDSKRIYLREAEEYERQADRLAKATGAQS